MANSAMETVETLQDASDVQDLPENRPWSEAMEQQVVEVENVNDDEPQRDSLIAPPGDEDVPVAIEKMINNGIKFTRSAGPWKVEQEGVRVRKSFSVYFTLDTHVPVQQIIMALDQRGIDYDDIVSIQRRLGTNTFVISFRTADAKAHILSVWDINVAGHRAFVADCDNRISLVKIYNAPNEMPDSVIIGRLSSYGSVLSFRRDHATDSIYNGVRTARMEIKQNIPSTVRITGEFIKFWYPGQPKSCRRCGDLDHLVKDCRNVRCFNCEQSGHRVEECEKAPMCSICRLTDHVVCDCPYLLFSANVECESSSNTSTSNSFAGAAKAPRSVSFNSNSSLASKTPEKEKENRKSTNESSSRNHEHDRGSRCERDLDRERERRERERERHERERRERERDRERERERERRSRDRSQHHRRDRSYEEDRRRSRSHGSSKHGKDDSSISEDSTSESDPTEWTEVKKKKSKHKRR